MGRLPPAAVVFFAAASCVAGQIGPPPVEGERAVVAGPEPYAVGEAKRVLGMGGNGVDAAVALGFALAVTLPSAGNLGGGGFMVIRTPDGTEIALDFRETAPAAATRSMFLGDGGKPVPRLSTEGHLASGVPGSVAGLCHAHAKFGSLPLPALVAGAIELAEEGFVVSRFLERSVRAGRRLLAQNGESRRIFLEGGGGLREGSRFRQPELAATLRRIAKEGAAGFYGGETARLIEEEMKRGGGLITGKDLADYRVVERDPVRGTYRGWGVVSMPPPSSGGVALVQMLNILEGYPLSEWGFGAAETVHAMAEAMRLAFRDRAEHLGDPDHTHVPFAELVAPGYGVRLRKLIGPRANRSEGLASIPLEREQTTHYSIMDANGWAVACTTTLNGAYGSGVTVAGAGFLLNNEMDDFAIAPGVPNMFDLIQGEANSVAPGRRPLSSMTPALLVKDGKTMMVVGSPGGPTIITTVLQCVVNVVDHGMGIGQAVAAPRFHHQWMPDRIVFEPFGLNPDVGRALEARGHRLEERRGYQGDAHGILIDPASGRMTGAADPRHGGVALSL